MQLGQFHQASLVLQLEAQHSALLPALLKNKALPLEAFVGSETAPSRSQNDVSAAFARLGWKHTVEFRTEEGLSLDMAQLESRTAVEYDGPHHHHTATGAPPRLNGRAALKRRLLEKLGWRVLSVPHFVWSAFNSTAERREYLARLLASS